MCSIFTQADKLLVMDRDTVRRDPRYQEEYTRLRHAGYSSDAVHF